MGGPIGVVVKTYPKLSETFILEEILALERLGLDLRILSLHPPTDERTNPENDLVQATVHYPPTDPGRLASMHTLLLARHPLRYLRALVSTRAADTRAERATFGSAVWLAVKAEQLGLASLHVHFISEPASVVEIAAPLAGLPFSISAHAKDIYLSRSTDLRRRLAAARFTVTCTDHNRQHLAAIADPNTVVERVHHGVDLSHFEPGQEIRSDKQETPMILAVGRLRQKKGFDLLIRACADLEAAGHDFECRIVGYGPEEPALRQLIDELGLGNRVRLLGKLTRDEVIEQYDQAAMLVQPCRITADGDRDGIPNVLLEAMAMGLPVVTTPVSGIPELVEDQHNGCLAPPDDAESLAATVAALLADPARRLMLGRRARATVEQSFTADRSAATIAKRLQQPEVAYVVKGYPRLSELFIATEIYRVEQCGMPLRLFVLKPPDEPARHEVVGKTMATPEYLPPLTSISKRSVWRWLAENQAAYRGPITRVALRHPGGFAVAAREALAQGWRARKGRWPRKLYLKEFFQAAAIADQVITDPGVRHLHAHFSHGATTVTWLAAIMSGRTFSFTAHAKDIYLAELNPAGLLARKLRAAEFVATCTEANRKHLLAVAPGAPVHTLYHGLNEEFSTLLEALPANPAGRGITTDGASADGTDEIFTILAVGRLVEKKGLDLLIEACVTMVEARLAVDLRIIGEEGEHGPVLRQLVIDAEIADHVSFLGPMDQPQLLQEYLAADVFCLPCRILADGDRDGIPNVLMEAMAAGLPVVSTPISGIPELIEDRHNGFLVAPERDIEVAKILFELHDDPELRNRVASAARETVRTRFDGWESTENLVDLLSTAIGRRPSIGRELRVG